MHARWSVSHVESYSNLTMAKERGDIFQYSTKRWTTVIRSCTDGRILLLTSQFCLTWLACRSRPWSACLKIEGFRMGQKLSLASITRNFLPCQVASRAIFSNGVTEHVFRYLREDSQMKSIFQRIPSNGLYLLILGHNGSMQHWPKQSPGQTTHPSALILTMMSFHALISFLK